MWSLQSSGKMESKVYKVSSSHPAPCQDETRMAREGEGDLVLWVRDSQPLFGGRDKSAMWLG